jgi:LuxR family maltose regulon positive regulatory protein
MNKKISRLNPPAFPDSVMERPEVNKAIDATMKKGIVYVHAPAGFGKTIAMSLWLLGNKIPAAWIPLTVYDDEPAVFCRYLLTALSELDSDAAMSIKTTLGNPGFADAPFEYFFRAVSSIAGENTQGIIVMDDFHLIENTAILNALPLIIRKLSQIHKLVILSRLKPPVSFSDLALKNEMGELNENDLRFTRKQIMGLYKNLGITLSPDEASDIEEKTGGWALGLGAELLSIKARGSESFLSQASGEKYIDGYLKREIWDKWNTDTQEFLLKTSILEDLTPELCDRLCSCDSEKILSRLMNESGLVVRLSDGSFRYHHILRDFLRKMAKERQTELSQLYIMAAQYMYKAGKFSAALDYYVKSGDYATLSDFLLRTVEYNVSRVNIEDYYLLLKDFLLDKVPMEALEKNVTLIALCNLISWATGDTKQMEFWSSKAKNLLDAADDIQTVSTLVSVLFLNPLISLWELAESRLTDNVKPNALPLVSFTANLPHFHRAIRDFSDYLEDWETFLSKMIFFFEPIMGANTKVVLFGIFGGIFYEQNKLAKAKEYILKSYSFLNEQSNPELLFAVYIHLADILFAEMDEKKAWESAEKARTAIEKNALYLKKNLDAMVTKYRLYKGDVEAARRWLADYAVSDSWDIALFQIPQILATVRAQIAIGEFSLALIFLAKLENLALNCHRPLDRLEVLILRAIIFWSQKQRVQAVDTVEEAVLLARPYGYIRMFSNEGAALIPILQKLYNRLSGNAEKAEMTVFVRTLLLFANESAEKYPGLTGDLKEKPVKLSKRQMRMLLYLAAGKNNRQICEETGLKLNTVKAHLFKLYEKLEVNSSTEAVLKSYRLGIIEKNATGK